MGKWKSINTNKVYLDFEVLNEREDYLKKVTTPGTLEYKLAERFKEMTLCQFLNHVSVKEK